MTLPNLLIYCTIVDAIGIGKENGSPVALSSALSCYAGDLWARLNPGQLRHRQLHSTVVQPREELYLERSVEKVDETVSGGEVVGEFGDLVAFAKALPNPRYSGVYQHWSLHSLCWCLSPQ